MIKRISFFLLFICFFSFSCTVPKVKQTVPVKVLIVYDSVYGSTMEISYYVARGIGYRCDIVPVKEIDKYDIKSYDFLLFGSPIFEADITTDMRDFLLNNRKIFQDRPFGLFVVCGAYLVHGVRWLDRFEHYAGYKAVIRKVFGGRLIVSGLNDEDRKILTQYWAERGKKEIQGFDFVNKQNAIDFGKEVRKLIETM